MSVTAMAVISKDPVTALVASKAAVWLRVPESTKRPAGLTESSLGPADDASASTAVVTKKASASNSGNASSDSDLVLP